MGLRSPADSGTNHAVYEVFTPTQPARLNFVHRAAVNDQLVDALRTPGKQLIVFGESGSGKSSLLLKKLEETYPSHVTTRCHASMTFGQLVLSAFDKLDHYYVDTKGTTSSASRGGSLSADFFKIRAAIDSARTSTSSESFNRLVPPQLTVQRLGEFMGEQELCWLIEDFHKIPDAEKTELAQSLKVFSDLSSDYPSAKIIAVGATETARQVVEYDPEMRNRVSELLVPLMNEQEISEILVRGSELLNVDMYALSDAIVQYAVGVPSVCHQLALNVCLEKGITTTASPGHRFVEADLAPAAERYVREASDTLKSVFDRALKRGKIRQYDNTRLIIKALASGPLEGMIHADILANIRLDHSKYPASNLTTYLKELSSEKRGPLVRKGQDGRFRFVEPIFHTYAQAALGIERRGEFEFFDTFVTAAMNQLRSSDQLTLDFADLITAGGGPHLWKVEVKRGMRTGRR